MKSKSRRAFVETLESRTLLTAYHLTFKDEFTTFDASHWQTSDFWGMRNNGGDYQAQWFSDTANNGYNPFTTNNGILSITAQPTPSGINSQGLPYVSGQLTTAHKFTQRYGYYELRAKTPPGKGLWSRFWMLGDDGNWPSGGEYDAFEILGKETNQVHQTTHYADANGNHAAQGYTYTVITPTDGFHTYGLLWESTGVTWYVDGVATTTQVNRVTSPMYVLIDLAVGNDPNNLWPGSPDASTSFPASLQVDYFRVYSADTSLPSVTPEVGITYPTALPGNNTVVQTSTVAQLPTGWAAGDLGTPDLKGSATWNSTAGEWMLKGAGYGIGGYSDQGHFAGRSLNGDGTITATVSSVTAINSNNVKTGVMMRDSTAANAREITLLHVTSVNPSPVAYSLVLQTRTATAGNTTTLATVTGVPKSATLRLSRIGNVFTASYSTDSGATWTTVGTPQTIAMATTALAGLAICGNQNNYFRLSRATFNNVTVTVPNTPIVTVNSAATSVVTGQTVQFTASVTDQAGLPIDTTGTPIVWSVLEGGGTISSTGLYAAPAMLGTAAAALVQATFGQYVGNKSITITLPSPWTANNITTTTPGDAGVTGNNWTVTGAGTGIALNSSWPDNIDSFRFINRPMGGDGTLIVRVDSSSGTQAGIVIRDGTGAGDRYAGLWRTADSICWGTREAATGGAWLQAIRSNFTTLPVWLRIVRAASTFTASYSTDGTSWTTIGSRTFAMNAFARGGLAVASGSNATTSTATFSNFSLTDTSPTVATPAGATPTPAAGTTVTLAVLGADDGGEASLTYTWSLAGTPPASVSFSANGTNAAKSTTAIFVQSGTYSFLVTITDAQGLSTTSTVDVVVNQTLSAIAVSPTTATLPTTTTTQFSAVARDQFGLLMATQPTFTWSKPTGGGSISTTGLYTAPATAGSATVVASVGAVVSPTASITIIIQSPTITTPASASPTPVTARTTTLSISAADYDGTTASLIYTWSLLGTPPAGVTFSENGTNAARTTTATFSKAGGYSFLVTVKNTINVTVTSTVNVIVSQTGAITITSSAASVLTGRSVKFSASMADQFGDPIETGSTPFTWAVSSGSGGIAADGTYTAASLVGTGTATVRATFGSISQTKAVTVTLPSPWTATNIGTTPAGDSGSVYGNWTVVGGGSNVSTSNKTDSFRFINQVLSADGTGTVIARVTSRGTTTQAGIMIRESTAPNARYAGLWRTSSGLQFATRETSNGNAGLRVTSTFTTVPEWLKLDRVGTIVTAYYSTDGALWTLIGTATTSKRSFTMATSAVAGLVVANASSTTTSTATFTNVAVRNAAPTVAAAAAASPSTVTGKTTTLSVLGSDDDGAANLRYTWSLVSAPASAPAPTFSDNATDSARQTIATFYRAGAYQLRVTISDDANATVISNVNVTVSQTLTGIVVSPSSTQVDLGRTRPFTATGIDQFGVNMVTPPAFTWAVASGPGSISSAGLYSAPTTPGVATITASSAGVTSASATIWTLDLSQPTLTSAVSSKVHGTTGTFNLNLAIGGVSKTIEPRIYGANKIIFNFSEPIQAVDGTLSANEFTITNATFASATISGNQLTLNLTSVFNQKYCSIALAGMSDLSGNILSGPANLTVGNLFCDVNQNGGVDMSDLTAVKTSLLLNVSLYNYLFDVNASGGTISVIDQQYVTNNQLKLLS